MGYGSNGSLGMELCPSRKMLQDPTSLSVCLHIPGQSRTSLACCLRFSMPKWPVCTCGSMSALSVCGTMIFSHFSRMLFVSVVSSFTDGRGHCFTFFGLPHWIIFFKAESRSFCLQQSGSLPFFCCSQEHCLPLTVFVSPCPHSVSHHSALAAS